MHHSELNVRHDRDFDRQHFGTFDAFSLLLSTRYLLRSYAVVATAKDTSRLFQACAEKTLRHPTSYSPELRLQVSSWCFRFSYNEHDIKHKAGSSDHSNY
jgi:hypothetical protein